MSLIDIYIMGKKYSVPASLTIMQAIEYAGYQLKRGCGCRSGFCGACATIYRISGDYEIKAGLACQTKVEAGMYLVQIPFFPAIKAIYDINELTLDTFSFADYYPEICYCIGCNSCTKVCPQNLNVMQYVAYAQEENIASCSIESFGCVMCGLCAFRCPASIVPYFVGILARRLYGKHFLSKDMHLQQRVDEIKNDKYEKELQLLMQLDLQQLRHQYNTRDISLAP